MHPWTQRRPRARPARGAARRPRRAAVAALAVLAALGCGGGPRGAVVAAVEARELAGALRQYERFRREEGGDGALLAEVAALLLEQECESDQIERRDAALSQLALAGTAGRPVLERVVARAPSDVVRAKGLAALASSGDGSALDALRGLSDAEDAEVLAAAVVSLHPERDVERLRALLEHVSAAVRGAAASQLRGAASSGAVMADLAEAARVDPDPSVRGAAVRSLGAFGPPAFELARERLSDADQGVRMAAVGALVRSDRQRALPEIGALLEMGASPASIEAARVLADVPAPQSGDEPEGVVLARAFLRRALASSEVEVRSQAAVALSSIRRDGDLERALLEVLESEAEARIKLSLAASLRRHERTRDAANAALRALLDDDGMPGAQAAALLSEDGDRAGLRRLARGMRAPEPLVRRVCARAMARQALRPDTARRALRDEDALVRIHAAGGILAASPHL